jgi:hypothetical protein
LFFIQLGNAGRTARFFELRQTLSAVAIDSEFLEFLQATARSGHHRPRYDFTGRNAHDRPLIAFEESCLLDAVGERALHREIITDDIRRVNRIPGVWITSAGPVCGIMISAKPFAGMIMRSGEHWPDSSRIMNIEVLRNELHRQPFEPFTLRLADGRSLYVKHPDFVAVAPRRVVVIDENDENMAIVEPLFIVSIEKKSSSSALNPPPKTNGDLP